MTTRLEQRLNAERSVPLARYQEDGFQSRSEYLEDLAAEHGLSLADISCLVDVLGPNEDFDGLVITLEDQAELIGGCLD